MALPRVTCRESVVSLHRDDPAARPKSSLASAWSKSGRCAGHPAALASCSRSAPTSSTTSRRRLPPLVPRLHQVPPPAALTAWPPRFVRFSSDCRGVPAL